MLIGLAGYAQAGKDTVGRILVQERQFQTTAFADPMRAAAVALNPIVDWTHNRRDVRAVRYCDVLEAVGYERAKENPEVREFLQRLGTEMGRNVFGQNFWVDRTFSGMDLRQHWAITDVRFENEAQAVIDNAGTVIRINRPDCVAANDHISEHQLDNWPFDVVIDNDGTIEDLTVAVRELFAWVT